MKKRFLLRLLLSLAVFNGMTSCSSDETALGNDTQMAGEKSYASFYISSGVRDYNRSSRDENADPAEEDISSVKIYIFSQGTLESIVTPEINSAVSVPTEVTTGEKILYAITNKSLPIEGQLKETKLADFEKQLINSSEDIIAEPRKFVMCGSRSAVIAKCTESEAAANPIKIYVDRLSAKLQVKFNNEDLNVYPTVNADFSSCGFAPAQTAKQMYLSQDINRFTPLGEKVDGEGTYPGLTSVPVSSDEEVSFSPAEEVFSPAYEKNRYMAENIRENPTTGKVTFALLRLKATPKGKLYGDKEIPEDGTFYVASRKVDGQTTWVYASDENYSIVYFANEDDVREYLSANNLSEEYEPCKFDKGLCYYRVNILNSSDNSISLSERYRVVRNNYYRINVTEIKNLGSPTIPGVVPDNPDTPIEQDAYISCEMFIVPWTMHNQDGVLQ